MVSTRGCVAAQTEDSLDGEFVERISNQAANGSHDSRQEQDRRPSKRSINSLEQISDEWRKLT